MKPILTRSILMAVVVLAAACSSLEQRKQTIPEPLVVTNPGSGTQPGSATAVTPPTATTPGSGTTTNPGAGTSTNPGTGTTTDPGTGTTTNPGTGTATTPPITTTPPTPPTTPTVPTPPPPPPPPTSLYLYNGKIRLGINLNAGGAITYLTDGFFGENMVNNFDLGRQLQTSLYSGPVPYTPNGQKPVATWANLGWNPVQTGDYYNNPAQVVSYNQTDSIRLYVKTIPLIWPLNNVVAECTMETWIELKNNTAHVRARTVINRSDKTQYEARTQETPCMYLNGPYYQKFSYTGSQPYTSAAVTELTNRELTACYATESWTALLNKAGRGLGLFVPNQYRFATAFFGATGVGSEYDGNTAYATAAPLIQMDHNGVYDYEYDLIVGNLTDIRQFVYAQPRPATVPDFRFGAAADKISAGRSGWTFYNTQDTGQPIQNELNVQWGRDDSTKASFDIKSPQVFYRAADVPTVYVRAAFTTPVTEVLFSWRKPEDIDFLPIPERQAVLSIIGDGQMRTYKLNLAGRAGWEGAIMQMRFDPVLNTIPRTNERAQRVKIKSVTVTAP